MTLRSASLNVLGYIALALLFAAGLAIFEDTESASLFLTGYVLEWSLSVDNLIAFTGVFAYFGVPPEQRHKVLYWGFLGAIVGRFVMVLLVGGPLFLFGRPVEGVLALLVGWSAWKTAKGGGDEAAEVDHEKRWYIRWTKSWLRVTPHIPATGTLFDGVGYATPLFLCLVAIEITDVMFAFDSVPTVVSVTGRPLLAYSAMLFAVLGLRSLYFVLEVLQRYLTHLGTAVSVVLGFIALKLGIHAVFGFEVGPGISLVIVLGTLVVGVIASLAFPAAETSDAK